MKVSEIWVYPIKSLGGIQLQVSNAMASGLEWDRRMMLIDKSNTFISQRSHPLLATLGVSLQDNAITVYKKQDKSINFTFNFHSVSSNEIVANVWEAQVCSFAYPDSVNHWFSKLLHEDIRLVRQVPSSPRTRSLPFSEKKIDLSYADGYPYLFLSKASVEQLNREVDHFVDIRQFRANIIVADCKPFDEDLLDEFTLGEAKFKMVKPCKRCPVININQDTGESNKATTKHLSTSRRDGNTIIFGMNAAILHESIINIGDTISKL